jgi:hypothetical protein
MAIRRIKKTSANPTFDAAAANLAGDILGAFADFAIAEKNKVMSRPVKRPSKVTTFVGGQRDRDEYSVKPGENIVYEFDYLKNIIIDAMKRLKNNSPVDRSADRDKYVYRNSHIILVNGKVYNNAEELPDEGVTEVIITNLMPYARKVEMRGWGKLKFHVPYHTYEFTATELKRYSNFVNIKFTFIDMPGFAAGKQGTASEQSRSIRYPALIITTR